MTALAYRADCHGDGLSPCEWTAADPGADLAARKHTDAAQHATSTHVRQEPKP